MTDFWRVLRRWWEAFAHHEGTPPLLFAAVLVALYFALVTSR